jgi:hypothetical protein
MRLSFCDPWLDSTFSSKYTSTCPNYRIKPNFFPNSNLVFGCNKAWVKCERENRIHLIQPLSLLNINWFFEQEPIEEDGFNYGHYWVAAYCRTTTQKPDSNGSASGHTGPPINPVPPLGGWTGTILPNQAPDPPNPGHSGQLSKRQLSHLLLVPTNEPYARFSCHLRREGEDSEGTTGTEDFVDRSLWAVLVAPSWVSSTMFNNCWLMFESGLRCE